MSRDNKIAIGVLLWVQAMFLGSSFGTWLPVITTTLLATMLVYRDHGRSRSSVERGGGIVPNRSDHAFDRSSQAPAALNDPALPADRPVLNGYWIGLATVMILAVCVLWRLASQADTDVNVLSVAIDGTAHAALFCSLLLWAWRPNRGHHVMLGLGLLVLLFGVAAGGISRSRASQTSIALIACAGFAVATQVIQGTARGARTHLFGSGGGLDERTQRMTRIVSLTAVSLLLMTTGVIASATNWALPTIQQAIQERLSESLEVMVQRTGIGGTRYVRSGRLGAVRDQLTDNPTEVCLIVESNSRPGYLRGRVYDHYQSQRWISARASEQSRVGRRGPHDRAISPTGKSQVRIQYRTVRPLNHFPIPTEDTTDAETNTHAHLVVYNDPTKGYIVFTPLTTRWIAAKSNQLILDEQDVVGPGIDITSPYVVGVSLQPRIDMLSAERRAILTTVPEAFAAEAARIAKEVCPHGGSARTKAAQVSRYFQARWDYSLLPTEAPAGTDPIAHFLRLQHPAHCEYFAAATTAILRELNVPTRYVTGYIVDELEEDKTDLWLARNQDAHAWVEAYDDLTNRWFAVESTPGRTYQTVSMTNEDGNGGATGDNFEDDDDTGTDSWLGQAWVWIVSLRASDALIFVYQIAQFPLFLFLVAYWWRKFRQPSHRNSEHSDRVSWRMLRSVDRTVRKHSLYRESSETLNQFADRIESHAAQVTDPRANSRLNRFANWYRHYASARYRGRVPNPIDSL